MNTQKTFTILLALCLTFTCASQAFAGSLHFESVQDQSINLGAEIQVGVSLKADQEQAVEFLILPNELSDAISSQDVSIDLDHSHLSLLQGEPQTLTLSIHTRTSAPSLTAKKFILQAKSQTGELTQIEIALSILPTYVIQVIDGDDQTNPATSFDFDSQKDIAYFRPHAEGLQLIFLNKSTKSFVIHGEGLIKHQDTHVPTSPGQEYLPPNTRFTRSIILIVM